MSLLITAFIRGYSIYIKYVVYFLHIILSAFQLKFGGPPPKKISCITPIRLERSVVKGYESCLNTGA